MRDPIDVPGIGGKAAFTRTSPALEARDRPATRDDAAILERADSILSDRSKWNPNDTRRCADSDAVWSLFCALQKASIEILGEYDHRRVAIQEVRFAIEDVAPRDYTHRLMEFNNLASTRFEDVKRVIAMARVRVASRLQ